MVDNNLMTCQEGNINECSIDDFSWSYFLAYLGGDVQPPSTMTEPSPKSSDVPTVTDVPTLSDVPDSKRKREVRRKVERESKDDGYFPKAVFNKPMTVKDRINELLRKAESRPVVIKNFARRLGEEPNIDNIIHVISPTGMCRESYEERLLVDSMMEFCVNEWLGLGVLNWYTMYLYEFGRASGLNRRAYFNVQLIAKNQFNHDHLVIEHIKDVFKHHMDKQYFLAPYLAGGHWVLIMIHRNPVLNKFYGSIIDSLKGGKNVGAYHITKLFENAVRTNIKWKMINCPQQHGIWECGYYAMHAMYNFVITNREHLIMDNDGALSETILNQFVENVMTHFFLTYVK